MDTNNPNMGRPVRNKYGVNGSQWDAWTNRQRRVFNAMWHELRPSRQYVFLPQGAKFYRAHEWEDLRYAVAAAAADVTR